MNQQAGKVRIVGRDKEKEMLARLSWLLLDAGTSALKNTFDSVHPPASLREHLGQTHVKAILQRLHTQVLATYNYKMWPCNMHGPHNSCFYIFRAQNNNASLKINISLPMSC